MIGAAPRFAPGTFYVKRLCYNFPPKEEMKDFLPVQINQKYIVTGLSQDVFNSMQVVKSTLDKYTCVTEPMPRMSDEIFKEYIKRRQEIQMKTEVHIRSAKQQIAYVGEIANIEEAKQEIKELIEARKNLKMEI